MSQKAAMALINTAELVKDPDHRDTGCWRLVAADGTVIAHVEPSYGGTSRSGRNGWHGWPDGSTPTRERHPTRQDAAVAAAEGWVRIVTALTRH